MEPYTYHLKKPASSPRPAPSTHVPAAESTADARPLRSHVWPSRTNTQPMTKGERVPLVILATKAFKEFVRLDPEAVHEAKTLGVSKANFEKDWRHSHCKYATSHPEAHPAGIITGISMAKRGHWEALAAHFAALAGEDLASVKATLRDGPAPGRPGRSGDRQSDIRQALAILKEEQTKLGISDAYLAPIIASKFHQKTLGNLERNEIWQVIYTIRNRAKTRDEDGDPGLRNMGQRKATEAKRKARRAGKV